MSDSSINMKTRTVAKVACSLRAFPTAPGQWHAEISLPQWTLQSRYFVVCNFVEELNCLWFSGTFVLNEWNLSAAVYRTAWHPMLVTRLPLLRVIREVTQTEPRLMSGLTAVPEIMFSAIPCAPASEWVAVVGQTTAVFCHPLQWQAGLRTWMWGSVLVCLTS